MKTIILKTQKQMWFHIDQKTPRWIPIKMYFRQVKHQNVFLSWNNESATECLTVTSLQRKTSGEGGKRQWFDSQLVCFCGGWWLNTHVRVCLPERWACWRCPCAGRNTPLWPPRSHWLSANRDNGRYQGNKKCHTTSNNTCTLVCMHADDKCEGSLSCSNSPKNKARS